MKKLIALCITLGLLAPMAQVSADSYTKTEFLTIMLNYAYSVDYSVPSSSYKCGDTKNTVSKSGWELDIDGLTATGKVSDTTLYFNGNTYAVTGTIKKKENKGTYAIDLEGEYASEQASGTADITVTGHLKAGNPYKIKKMKIVVKEHRTADFTERECTAKAVVKNMEADTFLLD